MTESGQGEGDSAIADSEASSATAPSSEPSAAWVAESNPYHPELQSGGVTPPDGERMHSDTIPPASATPPSGTPLPPPYPDSAYPGSPYPGSYTRPPSGWATTPASSLAAATSAQDSSEQPIYQIIQAVSETDPENIQQVAASALALSTSYYQNVLSQARRSFIAAIISATVGLLFFIAAVSIFLVRNDVRAGTVSVVAGAIVEVISGLNFWLYGRTAAQLNLFHIRLERTQKYLLANSISTKLTGEALDSALTGLISSMAAQGAGHAEAG